MFGVKYVGPVLDHCYDDSTEVLTDNGWKLFSDLNYSDKLATLTVSHGLEYQSPTNIIEHPWNGDLLHFCSLRSGIDLLVTPSHNMYVQTCSGRRKGKDVGWRLEPACEIFNKHRHFKRNVDLLSGSGVDYINVAGSDLKTEDWLEFLGYYLSEGSSTITARKDYIVQIRQYGEYLQDMADALQRVSFGKINIRPDGRVIVNDKNLALYLKGTFGHSHEKFIPRQILNNCSWTQLRILFDALMRGDGRAPENGGHAYFTSSVRLRDDFQELLLKIGLSGSYCKHTSAGDKVWFARDNRFITATKDLWEIHVRYSYHEVALSGWSTYKSIFNKIPYKGKVYCATVPNHTLYVRRNGHTVWSGNSGYGEASRNNILSLHNKGVPVTIQPQCFERNPPPIANKEEREVIESLIDKEIDYRFLIIHLTPDLYPRFMENNVYTIGYTAWETTKLHPMWTNCCNAVDEMWVPSDMNIDALKNSGVNVPITKVPHGIDPDAFVSADADFKVNGLGEDVFKFYSIFQWIRRKNPSGLLRAYFNAFSSHDKVALIIKSYMTGSTAREKNFIKDKIIEMKKDTGLTDLPKVYFVGDLLSKEQLLGLHNYGDCLVSLHRCEGFGLTMLEAGLAGNPVIGTGFGGNTDFMQDENSYLVDYQETYVSGMSSFNRWYLGNQHWADPDLIHASHLMREVYENYGLAVEKGQKLKSKIKEEFSWDSISDIIIKRLENVSSGWSNNHR